MSKNEKRARFEKVASKRVQNVLKHLERLSNCSNKNNYDYTEEDVKKMLSAIKEKVKFVEAAYTKESIKENKNFFQF